MAGLVLACPGHLENRRTLLSPMKSPGHGGDDDGPPGFLPLLPVESVETGDSAPVINRAIAGHERDVGAGGRAPIASGTDQQSPSASATIPVAGALEGSGSMEFNRCFGGFVGTGRRGARPRQLFVSLKRLSRFCTSSSWRFRLSISPAGIRRLLGVRALGVARREWQRKHRKGALKQFHVPAHLFFQGSERAGSERLRHVFAKFLLLAGERRDRGFKEFRNHHLHIVAIETDQLAHERDGQEVCPALLSCSKMICVSTERVISSLVLAS